MTDSIFQQAYQQLRDINTRDRRQIMVEERDAAELRKASLSLEMSNQRADIGGLTSLQIEVTRALETKRRLLDETIATYESITKNAADLDVQIKRMETV